VWAARDLATVPTITTLTTDAAWHPDVVFYDAGDAVPDALILKLTTVSGSIEGDATSTRVAVVDDASAEFVAEGAEIDEGTPALSEKLIYSGKVSQLIRLSREQWVQHQTAGLLSTSVARAITRAANSAFLAQPAPTAPEGQPVPVSPPAGLLAN